MCFGSPKQQQQGIPQVQAPPQPPPAPAPTILPSSVSAQSAGENRRKQLEKLQYGLASTIKTSGKGILSTGSELQPMGSGKEKLGS